MTNRPWLTKRQSHAVTFLQTNEWRRREASARSWSALQPYLDAAWRVIWREPVLKARYFNQTYESERGGWMPLNAAYPEALSLTAQEVWQRQEYKKVGDLEGADLLRRVITGGSVELMDFLDGTLWVFGMGIIW